MREINRLHPIKQPLNSTRVNIYRELRRDLYYKSILKREAHSKLLTVRKLQSLFRKYYKRLVTSIDEIVFIYNISE